MQWDADRWGVRVAAHYTLHSSAVVTVVESWSDEWVAFHVVGKTKDGVTIMMHLKRSRRHKSMGASLSLSLSLSLISLPPSKKVYLPSSSFCVHIVLLPFPALFMSTLTISFEPRAQARWAKVVLPWSNTWLIIRTWRSARHSKTTRHVYLSLIPLPAIHILFQQHIELYLPIRTTSVDMGC